MDFLAPVKFMLARPAALEKRDVAARGGSSAHADRRAPAHFSRRIYWKVNEVDYVKSGTLRRMRELETPAIFQAVKKF